MRFLSFVSSSESFRNTPPPQSLMDAMGEFVAKSMKDGTVVDTGGLLPSSEGSRLHIKKGELTIADGPFTESKEVIGGWAILEAPDKAAAMRIAREFMDLHAMHWPEWEGTSELRAMFVPGMVP